MAKAYGGRWHCLVMLNLKDFLRCQNQVVGYVDLELSEIWISAMNWEAHGLKVGKCMLFPTEYGKKR